MNKKFTFVIGIFALGIVLAAAGLFGGISQAKGANAPSDWSGTWQMGPDLDTAPLGCTAGDGLARYTGIYYPATDKVYFLGGRCENNNTTGVVFSFDPVTQTYALAGVTMPVPVSNYQVVRVDDDGYGHGVGFYIVGGRKNDGTQTNAVQVYYPDDNTVAQITSDVFPPAAPYSPGGVVSMAGKIYVFGGFDGSAMNSNLYIYDTQAPEGSRWTLSSCVLPSARSYISAIGLGTNIYAIGGDEWVNSTLSPTADTLVLDTNDLGACWQDDLMADLPQANGDAPAAFVDENYIGGTAGGIFVAGGHFSPINRWVFRYDLATGVWETFPDLAIPDPATGRRNQPLVYIPSTSAGTGPGVPGLWTFGGYDGSGTNAMTESSEFFDNPASDILLVPDQMQVAGYPGESVSDSFTLLNEGAVEDSFNLSYTSDVTWTVTLPEVIGPVPGGGQESFNMDVAIPADVDCGTINSFTVTATGVGDPGLTASASVTVRVKCQVTGTITDANTDLPIENAYVWAQDTPDGLGVYYDAYTNETGKFTMPDVAPGTYYFGADALHYQPSFYPEGWPSGAITITVTTQDIVQDATLVGSKVDWDPESITVTLPPTSTTDSTLTLTNNGTGPYFYNVTLLDDSQPQPPLGKLAIPELPRVDQQILSDISTSPDNTTDFVVVMSQQPDLSGASNIADWKERGQAVYKLLTTFANDSQANLRRYLDNAGVSYTPLYIINGVIVHSGGVELVNKLDARADVAQLVANHKIAVEKTSWVQNMLTQVTVPAAEEWNILKVKAPEVWAQGFTGQGTVVAEIDTGTQFDHPALVNQYRGNLGAGNFDHNYNWFDPYAQCPDGGDIPCDPDAHGTHVMGTMVGDDGAGNQIGVAPGAKWISCKGGDEVSGYLLTNELLQCAQWILAPFDLTGANPNPDLRPNVVNNSWGGGPNDYWYTGAVMAWRAAGIFPAFANGNAGPGCETAHSPGDYWNSFASGASDSNDAIAGFSSRGPAFDTGFLKPNLTSPGANIRSSVPGNGYANFSGTSMASPHTAGAVALLLSAAPDLVGQVDLTAWTLEQSAKPLLTNEGCGNDQPDSHPNNTFGYGLLDVAAAVQLAQQGNQVPSWVTADKAGGLIEPGESTTVTLTFTAPAENGTLTATLMLIGDDPYNSDVRIPLTLNVGLQKFLLPIIQR